MIPQGAVRMEVVRRFYMANGELLCEEIVERVSTDYRRPPLTDDERRGWPFWRGMQSLIRSQEAT